MNTQPHLLLDTTTAVVVMVAALVIGAIIGSFLNVVIWRVPNHISIVNPKRSFCPNCKARIAWYDNIPVVSWLVLGAKCRHCKEPIAVRYPLVESLTGVAFAAVMAGAVFGLYEPWALPALLFFAAVSIVVAFIDLDHHLILNVIIYPSLGITAVLLALASLLTGDWMRMVHALIGAVVLGAFYLLLIPLMIACSRVLFVDPIIRKLSGLKNSEELKFETLRAEGQVGVLACRKHNARYVSLIELVVFKYVIQIE